MGVIVDENGKIRIELVERYAPEFLEKLQRGDQLDEGERAKLVSSIFDSLVDALEDYEEYVSFFAGLEQGSYGLATGHEGLNAFFFRVCADQINEKKLLLELNEFYS